jgi:ribosomal subunit interface protein
MNKPLRIEFHGLERSDAVEAHVRERIAALERLFPQMTGCRVAIELPHKHHQQGKRFDVKIEITVPGRELVVNREHQHEDVYVALRDSLDAAKRQLDGFARTQRGEVKHHTDTAG